MNVIEWLVNRSALVQYLRRELDDVKRQRDLLLDRARGEGRLRAVEAPTVRDDAGPRCRRCRGAGVVERTVRGLGMWFVWKAGACPECGGVMMSDEEKERFEAQCARIEEKLMERGNRGGAESAERRVA